MAEIIQPRPGIKLSETLEVVAEALRGLQFGTVKLIVQDGVLVRVERTENRQVTRRK